MTDKKLFGLTEAQAREKLLKEGENVFEEGKKDGPFKIFLNQFRDLIILVLLVGAVISVLLGETADGIVIMVIILVNAFMGFIQEYRTEKSLEALQAMSSPMCMVIREGKKKTVAASKVVRGDILYLSAGDRIPADSVVISSGEFYVNESALTGESLPIKKDLNDEIYMGTGITSGRCTARVEETGMDTKMGSVARLLGEKDGETPLKKRLNKIGEMLVGISLGVCVIIAVAGIYYGQPLSEVFFSAVSLAVAAIPEGLPAAVTLCLAIGVRKMLRKNALVRKLPAVETLGCTTVICSDKTGTLTMNKMTVVDFYGDFGRERAENKNVFELMHKIGRLCLDEETDGTFGEPTEKAIFMAAVKRKTNISGFVRKGEIPFDSDRKMMSVLYENKGNKFLAVKGAADRLIPKCTKVLRADGETEFTPKMKEKVQAGFDEMAGKALRVIAFAYREKDLSNKINEGMEKDLVFVGFMGIMDPPRPEVKNAIKTCYKAGIKPVMITGDHKITAVEVAKQVGIEIKKNGVLTGDEIDALSERELEKRACDVSIYSRVTPEHKLKVIRALKKMGNIVAMTGDGVNDAPALKEADIGISMGKSGTDVAKEASTVILTDDNFSTIVAAVEEGRIIYNNIRKFIRYLLSCNLGEILLMGCAAFMGLPVPLLPLQILWVNLVTDGLPALALGMCKGEGDIMEKGPRNPAESIFAGGLGGSIVFSGLLIGASSFLAFVLGYRVFGSLEAARTMCFCVIIIAELIFALSCRSEKQRKVPVFENKYLLLAVGFSFVLMMLVLTIPNVADIFAVCKPEGYMWGYIILLGCAEMIIRWGIESINPYKKVIKKGK